MVSPPSCCTLGNSTRSPVFLSFLLPFLLLPLLTVVALSGCNLEETWAAYLESASDGSTGTDGTGGTDGTDSTGGTDSNGSGQNSVTITTAGNSGGSNSNTAGNDTDTAGNDTDSGGNDTDSGGNDTDSGDSDSDSGDDEPILPPKIVKFYLQPNPKFENGAISVKVWTEYAEGVTMEYGKNQVQGTTIDELIETDEGVFEGEIAVLTGLDNGLHTAQFTPWYGMTDGVTKHTSYMISLPPLGKLKYWDTGGQGIGEGVVNAIAFHPNGDLIELGTIVSGVTKHCYIRRRKSDGTWKKDDLLKLVPDQECQGVDLKISKKGEYYPLLQVKNNFGWFWWLTRMPSWDPNLTSLATGDYQQVAYAIAERKGMIAVCGTTPTVEEDLIDAHVRMFLPDLPDFDIPFDYQPNLDEEHKYQETPRTAASLMITLC